MQQTKPHNPSRARWLLLIGILTAFTLRIYKLGADSLWYDETVSVALARKSISGLLAHTAGDIHPPGYYLLLHLWQRITAPKIFATSIDLSQANTLEFLYAWPSFFFGVLLVALLFTLGRRLFSQKIGLIAAWLAAINPYQIWYSQEVRMYTLIATIGLICLYTLLKWSAQNGPKRNRLLIAYSICAAAGLYIHYYLLFGLVAINLIALYLIWQQEQKFSRLGYWIGAQIGVLVLWLPWLPTFWKQATDPPVPPWRESWTAASFIASLHESIVALFIGQSLPSALPLWVWSLILGIIGATFLVMLRRPQRAKLAYTPNGWLIVILYIFVPILILYSITALGTPIYHVRYLFLFAPLFLLIVANGLQSLWAQNRLLFAAIAAALLTLNGLGFAQFWHSNAHQADDHRAAVTALAAAWRPGDLILVNAGWTYTALDTYWPTAINNARSSVPPPLAARSRLTDYLTDDSSTVLPSELETMAQQPQVLYSGTIDGDPNLGWGSAQSDFYAISQADMANTLSTAAEQYSRIWHYRLYDTNSDPTGAIRNWLDQNSTQLDDQLYAGPASLRVQLFDTGSTTDERAEKIIPINTIFSSAEFGETLLFDYAQLSTSVAAGNNLYVQTNWTPLPNLASQPANLRFSLRLYAETDQLVVQNDQSPLPPTSAWIDLGAQQQWLALPIPAGAQPRNYSLEVVVYREDSGEALSVPESERSVYGQRLKLGIIDVLATDSPFHATGKVASFDYIDLLTAAVDRPSVNAGEAIHVQLVWLPRASDYTDTYSAIFALESTDGVVVQSWNEPAGGSAYPSGHWVAEKPVAEQRTLAIDPLVEAGNYRLTLRLERASDGLLIDAVDVAGVVVE